MQGGGYSNGGGARAGGSRAGAQTTGATSGIGIRAGSRSPAGGGFGPAGRGGGGGGAASFAAAAAAAAAFNHGWAIRGSDPWERLVAVGAGPQPQSLKNSDRASKIFTSRRHCKEPSSIPTAEEGLKGLGVGLGKEELVIVEACLGPEPGVPAECKLP